MRLAIVAASLLVLFSTIDAAAQATPAGEIQGKVADSSSGQPIGRGSITVRRQRDTAFVGGALPNSDGTFRINGLPPGQYTLRFRALGLAPVTRNNLVITPDKPILNIGTISPSVVVTKLEGHDVGG